MRVLRVAVVGAGGVGKSSVTVRFINGLYTETYDPTIEDSYRKQIEVDGRACLMEILDTAGYDQYLSIGDLIIRDNDCFVIVFSLSQADSLVEVQRAYQSIQRIKSLNGEHVPLVLVGNKCDLVDDREVDPYVGQKLAAEWKCQYFEASARTNTNITAVFEAAVRQLREHGSVGKNSPHSSRRERHGGKCLIL